VSRFDIEAVTSRLIRGEIPWSLHYKPECASTQDLARIAISEGAEQGWIVVSDFQTQGRGRQGRSWEAPRGEALLFSTVLRPPIDVLALLPLLAGLTVAGGIEVTTGAAPDLKWPNDVLMNGKKLAGVLLERPPESAVVLGVGINVNQASSDLPDAAISLAAVVGHPIEREVLLAAILNDLDNAYDRADREGVDWIVPAWRSRSSMLGQPVVFFRDGSGTEAIAEDIGANGALIVRAADGTRVELIAGEVERVRIS
jgi:BirA family transcriptional regulator, biotin operon repressor / biotin---[acetyl-CoA-carboxylase] ligase